MLVGVAGFEPATSSFRTKSATGLRYTPEMARCTGLEPVSLDRQSSCLTRCITAQCATAGERDDRERSSRSAKTGVPGSTRTSTGRALNAFPLPLGYRHETAQPGFARSATTGTRLLGTCPPKLQRRRVEDQAGSEPAVGMRQRIKSPPRSATTVTGPWRTRVVTIHMPTG